MRRAGLQMTVRGHWHYAPKQIAELAREQVIHTVYLFPHLAERYGEGSPKIRPMAASYNPALYRPSDAMDPRLVVRTSAAKKTKELADFVRIATRCPDHRFVLAVCSLGGNRDHRELKAANREHGSPVEIRTDLGYEEVSRLVAEAGIYLHTYTDQPEVPFGMPVSIAEAMATGSYVLARRLPGAEAYVGDAGALYGDEEEAAELVRATEQWNEHRWRAARESSTVRADRCFQDGLVLRPMLSDWLAMAGAAGTVPPSV